MARFVRVDTSTIEGYAAGLPLAEIGNPQLDPATHYLGEPEATLTYVVTLDTINFGSGYFPWLRKRPGLSGYFTVARSLKEHFERDGPFSAEDLTRLTAERCAYLFGQSVDGPAGELMALFARALGDLGRFVLGRFEGSFHGLVDAADGSAERLAHFLTEMPFYRDVARYADFDVPFYKRAQLTAADLATAGVARFSDLDRLTVFADNVVPHVLRLDGVLVYDLELVARVERETLLLAGSPEEVEIRASAVHAVEQLAAVCQRPPMQLDYLLWNRGQQPAYKAAPRHRTRSVFY